MGKAICGEFITLYLRSLKSLLTVQDDFVSTMVDGGMDVYCGERVFI